mgnify:CR=1 FL=1
MHESSTDILHMDFILHPQLAKDTTVIGHFPLCIALLHKDNAVPWVILVPKRNELKELHHLPMNEQQQFLVESQTINQTLEVLFTPDKINLGALGNMVPQLHIHHIVRKKSDAAWPDPVWGAVPPKAYKPNELSQRIDKLIACFESSTFIPSR